MNREMKHSGIAWIGEIPVGWDLKRLQSQVVEINEKNSPLKTDYVLSLTIKDGVIPYEEKGDVGNKAKENHEDYKLAYPDTIVLNSMNILIGAVGICKYYGCVSPVYYVLKPTPKSDLRYLNYIMSSTPFQKYLRKYANGILEIRMRVSADDILKRHIPIPSLAEQKAIADFLDKKCGEIDELVALQEKIIEELKSYKQSVITETVCKGLNPNVPMKDSGVDWIGEIPEGWEVSRFKNIASVKANLVSPEQYPDLPQVAPDNIEKDAGILLNYKKVKDANIISDNHLFYKGQIVYSKIRPTLNKAIIAPFDGLCSADMYPIETTQHTKYMLYFILSGIFTKQVQRIVNDRVKMPKINKEEISTILAIIPPIYEQEEIADYLDKKCLEIDQLITIKQQKIVELKEYKKSLIYEYTTGKKCVEA